MPTLLEIKTYLQSRPGTDQILSLSDQTIQKFLNNSYNILNVFYKLQNFQGSIINIVAEQIIHLFHNDQDFSLLQNYQGLSSFNIGKGSVQGTVNYSLSNDVIGKMVKAICLANHIEKRIEDPDSDIHTSFIKV